MVADATVVVEHMHAAPHLEKLVITLSPAQPPGIERWIPRTTLAEDEAARLLPGPSPRPNPARSQSQPSLLAPSHQNWSEQSVTPAEPVWKAQKAHSVSGVGPRVAAGTAPVVKLRSNLRRNAVLAIVVAVWYSSNIGLVLTNRHLLGSGFEHPVFLTLCHMVASGLVPVGLAHFRGGARAAAPSAQQLCRLAALAAVFSASVVLGNVALRFIPVSFFQAICATTPAFVAALALLMLNQRESRGVYLALAPVIAGLMLATGAEPSFNALGFAATVAATILRALKTVLQAMLLKDVQPTVMLRYMALMASALLLLATVVLERGVLAALPPWRGSGADLSFYAWLTINCGFAFATNLSNFVVVKYTSPLTMQVLGNVMGVCGTGVSIIIFRNDVSAVALSGYSLTMAGVCMFAVQKHSAAAAAVASSPALPKVHADTS